MKVMVAGIYGLVSKLHQEKDYKSILKKLEKIDGFQGVINEPKAIEKDAILFHITGGTSSIAFHLSKFINEPVTLIAHPYNNSLPSLLSAKERIEKTGKKVITFFVEEEKDLKATIEKIRRVREGIKKIINAKVGVIGKGSDSFLPWKNLVSISWEEIERKMRNAKPEKIERAKKELKVREEKIARAYVGLKEIVKEKKLEGLTFDCFEFLKKFHITPCIPFSFLNQDIVCACERDFSALFLLMLAKEFTGKSGWMANPSFVKNHELVLAHCTVAKDIARKTKYIPHFETKLPMAVKGEIKGGNWAMLALSKDFRKLEVEEVKVMRNENNPRRCVTQVRVKMGRKAEEFLESAVTNHHVLIDASILQFLDLIIPHLGFVKEIRDFRKKE